MASPRNDLVGQHSMLHLSIHSEDDQTDAGVDTAAEDGNEPLHDIRPNFLDEYASFLHCPDYLA